MSQACQIYVRYEKPNGTKELIARYFHWVFGERLVSRCRWSMEHINNGFFNKGKLLRVLDVNFDMKDVTISSDIIRERFEDYAGEEFAEAVFYLPQNDDGKLLIDISIDKKIKYAFLDRDAKAENVMDADAYMDWDYPDKDWTTTLYEEVVTTCKQNIEYIKKNATLMTTQEVVEFLEYNYEGDKDYGMF